MVGSQYSSRPPPSTGTGWVGLILPGQAGQGSHGPVTSPQQMALCTRCANTPPRAGQGKQFCWKHQLPIHEHGGDSRAQSLYAPLWTHLPICSPCFTTATSSFPKPKPAPDTHPPSRYACGSSGSPPPPPWETPSPPRANPPPHPPADPPPQGGALRAVRAQCSYLGAWPY